MGRIKIQDEFTNLPVSRQRKWQLRNPEKQREIWARHAKVARKAYYRANIERWRAQGKIYREKNREYLKEYNKQHYIKSMLIENTY